MATGFYAPYMEASNRAWDITRKTLSQQTRFLEKQYMRKQEAAEKVTQKRKALEAFMSIPGLSERERAAIMAYSKAGKSIPVSAALGKTEDPVLAYLRELTAQGKLQSLEDKPLKRAESDQDQYIQLTKEIDYIKSELGDLTKKTPILWQALRGTSPLTAAIAARISGKTPDTHWYDEFGEDEPKEIPEEEWTERRAILEERLAVLLREAKVLQQRMAGVSEQGIMAGGVATRNIPPEGPPISRTPTSTGRVATEPMVRVPKKREPKPRINEQVAAMIEQAYIEGNLEQEELDAIISFLSAGGALSEIVEKFAKDPKLKQYIERTDF